MAIMIPALTPQETRSPAEPNIYWQLKLGLADDFVVIHSLPWLCSAVKKVDSKYPPTGEIDFLVVHADLGVLAIEVKAGRYAVRGTEFVCLSGYDTRDPIGQLRRNTHGVAKWLGVDPALRIRFGYAFAFPDSQFTWEHPIPAMFDMTVDPPARIVIDFTEMQDIAKRTLEIMRYWLDSGVTHPLGSAKKDHLVNTICPHFDGTPSWGVRVLYDNSIWLRLTEQQSQVLNNALKSNRMLVTGWPGSGKTLIAVELARRFSKSGKTLVVVFNSLLREHLARQLGNNPNAEAVTWHSLCRKARLALGKPEENSDEWRKNECILDLQEALAAKLLPEYEHLILDEAQALRSEWIQALAIWAGSSTIHCFCDESQKFAFEEGCSLDDLVRVIDASPYHLTAILRTPPAVTQRLTQVRSDHPYQLTTTRAHDPDALQEVLTDDWYGSIQTLVKVLFDQQVAKHEITLLTRLPLEYLSSTVDELLAQLGIRHETVARFRGMESPVVILLGSEDMDEAQLFCAYSRATTLFIAIYDAEELAWKQNNMGRFAGVLLNDAKISKQVSIAREQALSSTLARDYVSYFTEVRSTKLGWSGEWKGWCIELQGEVDPAETWIDFLATEYPWPIYSWHLNSRREIRVTQPIAGMADELVDHGLRLQRCEKCKMVTPHQSGREDVCTLHLHDDFDIEDPPEISALETIFAHDKTIISLLEDPRDPEKLGPSLPIALAAVAHRLYAHKHGKRELKPAYLAGGKTVLYRLAMAFTLARIRITSKPIDRDQFAEDIFARYETWDTSITLKDWKSKVSNAFSVCLSPWKLISHGSAKGHFVPNDSASTALQTEI